MKDIDKDSILIPMTIDNTTNIVTIDIENITITTKTIDTIRDTTIDITIDKTPKSMK